jgi:hypothetical protein
MLRRIVFAGLMLSAAVAATTFVGSQTARAATPGQPANWNQFYHYPYVYYPHNFEYNVRQYNSLYYKYPPQRRIPVYNKDWHNFYTMPRSWYKGKHFHLDVF